MWKQTTAKTPCQPDVTRWPDVAQDKRWSRRETVNRLLLDKDGRFRCWRITDEAIDVLKEEDVMRCSGATWHRMESDNSRRTCHQTELGISQAIGNAVDVERPMQWVDEMGYWPGAKSQLDVAMYRFYPRELLFDSQTMNSLSLWEYVDDVDAQKERCVRRGRWCCVAGMLCEKLLLAHNRGAMMKKGTYSV